MLYMYSESIKMVNPQRNARNLYSETVPSNGTSGLLEDCDSTSHIIYGKAFPINDMTCVATLMLDSVMTYRVPMFSLVVCFCIKIKLDFEANKLECVPMSQLNRPVYNT